MSLLDTLEPELRPWAQALFDVAKYAGVNPRVTSARRSYATQEKLYRAFKEGRSPYPAARPGTSAHEFGLAFDMVVVGASNQVDCGIVWTSWGGDYGGEEDPIHFQYPGFTPPPAAATEAVQPVDVVPVYTPSRIEVRARQLADELLPGVLEKLGYSVSIAALTRAIEVVLGIDARSDVGVALGTLAWASDHPEEFLGQFWDAMRSILLSYL